jgi:hypothetical protein
MLVRYVTTSKGKLEKKQKETAPIFFALEDG